MATLSEGATAVKCIKTIKCLGYLWGAMAAVFALNGALLYVSMSTGDTNLRPVYFMAVSTVIALAACMIMLALAEVANALLAEIRGDTDTSPASAGEPPANWTK